LLCLETDLNINNKIPMKTKPRGTLKKPAFAIRVHLTDGSVESFAPPNEAEAQKLWDRIEPSRLFTQPRLVLAGERFKSVFVTSNILRVDFIQDTYECWKFPGGYSDVVELSEAQFRKLAHLDRPELMARREQPTPVGDLLVSFLKLHITGAKPLYLMIEFPVKEPDENLSFIKFLLSKGGFHLRLRGGGIGVVNLAHLAGYTVYPGVPQVPIDTWLVEPLLSKI
jgi:hypothetical protein